MKFIELTVHTTTEASEIIADIMWNYTNYGVTICDVNDIIALQKSKDTMYWDYMVRRKYASGSHESVQPCRG